MRKLLGVLVIMAATISVSGTTTACADLTGACTTAIKVTNDSVNNTTQEVLIDGVRMGALTPGQSDTWEVAPGQHIVAINNAAGGVACTAAVPIVEECSTYGLICRG
jgi:hypothetical protein